MCVYIYMLQYTEVSSQSVNQSGFKRLSDFRQGSQRLQRMIVDPL